MFCRVLVQFCTTILRMELNGTYGIGWPTWNWMTQMELDDPYGIGWHIASSASIWVICSIQYKWKLWNTVHKTNLYCTGTQFTTNSTIDTLHFSKTARMPNLLAIPSLINPLALRFFDVGSIAVHTTEQWSRCWVSSVRITKGKGMANVFTDFNKVTIWLMGLRWEGSLMFMVVDRLIPFKLQ